MKYKILTLIFALVYIHANCQQIQFDWISQAGGPEWDVVTDMKELPNGQLAVIGTFYESINFQNDTLQSNGSRDVFIAQYSSDGNLNQVISIGGEGYDYAKIFEPFGDKGLILPVKFYQNLEISGKKYVSDYSNNFLITFFDESLSATNNFLVSSTKEFDITSLKSTSDGSCFFTGWFTDTLVVKNNIYESPKTKDIFWGKLNAEGELLWLNQLKGEGDDISSSLAMSSSGEIYLLGHTETGFFQDKEEMDLDGKKEPKLFVAEIGTDGNIKQFHYPLIGTEITPIDLLVDSSSLWILANIKNPVVKANGGELVSYGKSDAVVLKYEIENKKGLHCQIGGEGNDEANSLIKSGENILVSGQFAQKLNFGETIIEAQENGTDLFIAVIGDSCEYRNIFTLTGESSEFPCSAFASESGVYVTGEFRNKIKTKTQELVSAGKEDVFLARIENCGAKDYLNISVSLIDDSNQSGGWELDAGPDFKEYSWNDDVSNSRYLFAHEPGTYMVNVSDFFGCKYSKEIVLSPLKSGDIEDDLTGKKAFKLYPTITSDIVYWEPASEWNNKIAHVKVFDAMGRLISHNKINQLSRESHPIDFSAKTEGGYLVEISGDGFREVSKVMVQK